MEVITNNYLINILKTNRNPIESLSIRIALNSSAVLIGSKPASTITFSKSACCSGIPVLWDKYKEKIFKGAKLRYFELLHNCEHVLVFVYDTEKLEKLLNNRDISLFLSYLGYDKKLTLIEKLDTLKQKYTYCIPHEIGIFLGLPLKDVLSYMGLTQLNYSCTMGWRMYGSITASVDLYKQYRDCRNRIINMLANGEGPLNILRSYPEKHSS